MAELENVAVVITGAGGGLGAAYARAAAAHGASVVVNDVRPDAAEAVAAEIRAAGGAAVAAPCDIADPAAARLLVGRCIAEFGRITGLVNNAGLFFAAPLEQAEVAHLRRQLEVNVVGTFNCARAAIEPMLAQGYGSIVNVTSGAQAGQNNLSTYGASKGAVASFTYGWAGEFRERGIRVNAVSPLAFTAMAAHLPQLPPPEVNVPPVLYLLSDRSAGVTGQVIRIAGDKLSLMTHPGNRAPILEREQWTLTAVAEAFDATLRANQLPTDIATYEVAAVVSTAARLNG